MSILEADQNMKHDYDKFGEIPTIVNKVFVLQYWQDTESQYHT